MLQGNLQGILAPPQDGPREHMLRFTSDPRDLRPGELDIM